MGPRRPGSFFQAIAGLRFAFPRPMASLEPSHPGAGGDAYLRSDRRLPFSNGVFRHSPELDGD